jgi:hypothetical protein
LCSSFSGGKKLWCKATLGEERTSHQKKQYTLITISFSPLKKDQQKIINIINKQPFFPIPSKKKLITCSSFGGGKKLWCKATLGEERTSHQKKQYT